MSARGGRASLSLREQILLPCSSFPEHRAALLPAQALCPLRADEVPCCGRLRPDTARGGGVRHSLRCPGVVPDRLRGVRAQDATGLPHTAGCAGASSLPRCFSSAPAAPACSILQGTVSPSPALDAHPQTFCGYESSSQDEQRDQTGPAGWRGIWDMIFGCAMQ